MFKPARIKPDLIASRLPAVFGPVVAVSFADPANLPARIKIADWGLNEVRQSDGTTRAIFVNETTAAVLARMQHARGFDKVTLDYEHQSHRGSPTFKPDPRHDAGHGTIEVVPGEGVFYCAVDYTATGKEFAANYTDVSGVFWTNAKGEVLYVSSVALCQNGAIAGKEFTQAEALAASVMHALAASMEGMGGEGDGSLVQAARDFLNFDETAQPEDLARALAALTRQRNREAEARAQEAIPSKPATNPNPQHDKTMEPTEQIKALAASVTALAEGQKKILDRIEADDKSRAVAAHNAGVETAIAAAVQAGKVVPAGVKAKDAEGRYKLTADEAGEILKDIAATVQTQFTQNTAKPGGSVTVNQGAASDEAAVMASMGISEDAWKKGGIPRAWEPAPQAGVPDVK